MVFVDHPVESSSAAYGLVDGDDDGGVMVGWSLLASLARPVVVEMVDVLADYGLRVLLVVDQHVVGALLSEAAGRCCVGGSVGTVEPRQPGTDQIARASSVNATATRRPGGTSVAIS